MPKEPDDLGKAATMATPLPSSSVTVPKARRAPDLAAGTVVGEYHIVGKLGEGGMGAVYAAKHPVIGKKAAVVVTRKVTLASTQRSTLFVPICEA